MKYIMQARSSSTGELITWASATPDFAGGTFPGPGSAQYVAIAQYARDEMGGSCAGPIGDCTVRKVNGDGVLATVTCAKILVSGDDKVQPKAVVAHVKTTNTTQTAIDVTESAIAANTGAKIIAVITGISAADYASWRIECDVYRGNAGNAAFVGTTPSDAVTTTCTSGAAAWTATVDLATANTPLPRVTGASSTNITWGVKWQIVPQVI